MYHLLARDRDTFTCMRTWELFFAPSVALRKVCKALAALDRRLGCPLQKQLAAWEARCQERIRPEFAVYLRKRLRAAFPDNQVIVIDGGLELQVLGEGAADE